LICSFFYLSNFVLCSLFIFWFFDFFILLFFYSFICYLSHFVLCSLFIFWFFYFLSFSFFIFYLLFVICYLLFVIFFILINLLFSTNFQLINQISLKMYVKNKTNALYNMINFIIDQFYSFFILSKNYK
jgi:hypothetical protein